MGLRHAPRIALLTLGYAGLVQFAYVLAMLLRFEGDIPARFLQGYLTITPWFTALTLLGFFVSGLYHGLWRYASTVTLFQVVKGATLSAAALVVIMFFTTEPLFPRSFIVMVPLWELVLVGGVRFAWRLSRERVLRPQSSRALRTLVIGTGFAGVHLTQEMRRSDEGPEALVPIGFIDDDGRLTGHQVEGVKVLGTIADLPRILIEKRVKMVVVSDADLPARVVREIARFCQEADVRVKTLPGLSDFQQGRTAISQMRDVRIEDLLGRSPVHLDMQEIGDFLRGQRVLITGAGGSIGGELVRQITVFEPAELVMVDHAENGLYYVEHEVLSGKPAFPVYAMVGDIRDLAGMERIFDRFRPEVVFHAAAHKHVPLLETNPREAVLNNIVGTRNLVAVSDRAGVRAFVLISTDKAVNPSSVMGASKRVCEMILQSRSQTSRTRFTAVRFGNVLGSDGSVIPLFQRQIARGGPITVTHPEARRYFMTIPEAVRLVIQAGAMAKGGEVYLLDMGEQVRIADLARQLVRMAGLREGEDIEIVFTGLRPGEKLYEELHSDAERTRITRNERILVWDLDARDEGELLSDLDELERVAQQADGETIKRYLHRIVPEYVEPHHSPLADAPPEAVVELPAAIPLRPPGPAEGWPERTRAFGDAAVAALLIAATSPLWALLFSEARRAGVPFLLRESRIGRTRRAGGRRARQDRVPIERRHLDRRTQDLLGEPLDCQRFQPDSGPISRWVARHRLDKLPFLLTVVSGEMALVGPKPEKEELVLRWMNVVPDYARRFSVKPGVTGLAQVSVCADGDAEGVARRVRYDLHYVDHRSMLLDLRTLLRTLSVVWSRPRGRAESTDGGSVGAPAVKGVTR
jgi:FlaA1/EpsC-like NDP-sugar epimerase